MSTPYLQISSKLVDRYLNLLGVQRHDPSFLGLSELLGAHLYRVPFENISKLYYKTNGDLRGLPDIETYLDGIEYHNFGGTCYSNNYFFSALLANLGYQAILCGADMNNPDVHLNSMVAVEGREYLIDVGYAAPFWTPMPLDLDTDYSIALGSDRYVLKPRNESGNSKLELYRDGELKHGYLAKPFPREIHEFEDVIGNSFRDESTFMNALLLAKFSPEKSYVIHNFNAVAYHRGEPTTRRLENTDELVQTANEWFGIPSEDIQNAIDNLNSFEDPWD